MWGEENTSQLRKRWCSELRLSTRPSGLADAEPKTDRPPSEIPERATGAPEVKRTPGARRPGGARGPAAPTVGFPRARDAERSTRRRHFRTAQALPRDAPGPPAEVAFLSRADIVTTLQQRLLGKSLLAAFRAVPSPAEAGPFRSALRRRAIDTIP